MLAEEFITWIPVEGKAYTASPPHLAASNIKAFAGNQLEVHTLPCPADSINPRSASLCSWGFEALVSSSISNIKWYQSFGCNVGQYQKPNVDQPTRQYDLRYIVLGELRRQLFVQSASITEGEAKVVQECIAYLDVNMSYPLCKSPRYEQLNKIVATTISIEKHLTLEIKPLPSHLKYSLIEDIKEALLEDNQQFRVNGQRMKPNFGEEVDLTTIKNNIDDPDRSRNRGCPVIRHKRSAS
ncbi:hypothetical protein M9H77_07162 [Catharanthus roseus]|uniref:Uncharacterized protein n=1 Tax=Catharanthus roseus TaxID=4058 RepID=A0ACC0BUF0_CATRO|nr:hypothetical protein M9H77_07162 [Catharanthus roseus]